MRKGYLNLVETLRLLTVPTPVPELKRGWIELLTATGENHQIVPESLRIEPTEIFAQLPTDTQWIQIPIDEIVGLIAVFDGMDKPVDFPALLAELRKGRKPAA